MTKNVQLVRYSNAAMAGKTGLAGELMVNTTNRSVVVHDGVTPGGKEQARADLSNVGDASASAAGKMTAAQASALASNTTSVADLVKKVETYVTKALSDSDYTLTAAEYDYHLIEFTGTLTTARTLTFPLLDRTWLVKNSTNYGLGIKCAGGSSVGSIVAGGMAFVSCQGGSTTAFLGSVSVAGTTPVANGGTGAVTAADALTNLGFSTFVKSIVADATAAAMRASLGILSAALVNVKVGANEAAGVNVDNVFSADQSISKSDDGAGIGPSFTVKRISTSPAAADLIGLFQALGKNSAAADIAYARLQGVIADPTSGAEYGEAWLQTYINGVLTTVLALGDGIVTPGVTGGYKGANTANFESLYIAGEAVPFSKAYDSGLTAMPAVGASTSLTHGLGGKPKITQLILECVTTEHNYSVGDQIYISPVMDGDLGSNAGLSTIVDNTTQIKVLTHSASPKIANKSTGAAAIITLAKWNFIMRAWA